MSGEEQPSGGSPSEEQPSGGSPSEEQPSGGSPSDGPRTGGSSGDPLYRTAALVAIGLLVALAVTFVATVVLRGRLGASPRLALLVLVKLLVTTFNVVVLLALTGTYVAVYRDLPNRFTLSLVLFSVALLLYAVTSNPLFPLVFGFRGGVGLGPFTFIPDLFASVAIVVLLYQSHR